MDLAQVDTASTANAGQKLELRGPDGAPLYKADGVTPVTLTLLGKDSDAFIKARNATANRYLKQRGKAQVTAEGSDADQIAILVRCTVGWDGIGIDEDETPFTPENAARLYNRFRFIREQADEFIDDRANFLKASSTS